MKIEKQVREKGRKLAHSLLNKRKAKRARQAWVDRTADEQAEWEMVQKHP